MESEAFRFFDFYKLQYEINIWMKDNPELTDFIFSINYSSTSINDVTEYTALIFYRNH